jgi:hypothetical protein
MSEKDERHLQDEFLRKDGPDVEGHLQDEFMREDKDKDEEPDVQGHLQDEFMREDTASERHRVDEAI